jgi:uncharacterized membrane protein
MNPAIIIISAHILIVGTATFVGRSWLAKQKNTELARYRIFTLILIMTAVIAVSELVYRCTISDYHSYSALGLSPFVVALLLQQNALRKLKTQNENGA